MDDHRHTIDLCPDCEGLRTVRMDRLPGVTSITMTGDDGRVTPFNPTAVYIGPVPGPCPNPKAVDGG